MRFLNDDILFWPVAAILRLVVAAVLGAMIGLEREHHGRSAGFRTQLLVALGSALAMVVSLQFGKESYAGWAGAGVIRVDPARMAYGVMAGIGFLGAGAIIREGANVRGLTTAAGLWCTAAVGLACGFGMYLVAVVAAAIVLFALLVLSRLDRFIPSQVTRTVRVTVPCDDEDNLSAIREALAAGGAKVGRVAFDRDRRGNTETFTFHVSLRAKADPGKLLRLDRHVPKLLHLSIH